MITPVDNWGADPSPMWDPRGAETLLTHFAFAGYYLKCTRRENGKWTTYNLGRQGDGKSQVAALDQRQRIHVATITHRFRTDPNYGLQYLVFRPPSGLTDAADGWEERREIIDPGLSFTPCSISLDQRGQPGVLYTSNREPDVLDWPFQPSTVSWADGAITGGTGKSLLNRKTHAWRFPTTWRRRTVESISLTLTRWTDSPA